MQGKNAKEIAEMDVKDQVIEIIAEQAVLDVSDVTMDSTLGSLGIDSLGLVESIFAIEEAADIQVPFNNDPSESDFDISSVATIIAGIEKLVAEQSKRVVITGAGTINALGHNVPQTLEAMREGRCELARLIFAT